MVALRLWVFVCSSADWFLGAAAAVEMANKAQTSAANQTMKFVYSEAVTRALRQRCRGLATSTTTAEDVPPLPPEVLLTVLQPGELDLSAARTAAGRPPPSDPESTDDMDYEISNLAEIYGEISRAVEQVRRPPLCQTELTVGHGERRCVEIIINDTTNGG